MYNPFEGVIQISSAPLSRISANSGPNAEAVSKQLERQHKI